MSIVSSILTTHHVSRVAKMVPRLIVMLVGCVVVTAGHAAATPLNDALQQNGANVIFLRHALAPGNGDPANFDIQICDTQRNLSESGRDQSRRLGAYFKRHGIQPDLILSSAWCRCQDTATEMGLGQHKVFAGLNSFYDGHVDRATTIDLLRDRLANIETDRLVLMVTHQVVITDITGVFPPSGGMVVYNSHTGKAIAIGAPVRP